MKKGGGKAKGSAFERYICKSLSDWIGADEVCFWRSAMSGGRATVLAKQGKKADLMSGDISAIGSEGAWLTNAYSVECKSYATFSFDHFFTNTPSKSNLPGWWEQCQNDAKRSDKLPMLIFKKNRSPIYIGLDDIGFSHYQASRYEDSEELDAMYIVFKEQYATLHIVEYDKFLEVTDATLFKEASEQNTQFAGIRKAPDMGQINLALQENIMSKQHPDLFQILNQVALGFGDLVEKSQAPISGYPPHNIVKLNEENYELELAVAGFKKEEITIDWEKTPENKLIISGKKAEKDEREFFHKGISTRSFTKTVPLGEFFQVKGTKFEDGIVTVIVDKVVPKEQQPQSFTL